LADLSALERLAQTGRYGITNFPRERERLKRQNLLTASLFFPNRLLYTGDEILLVCAGSITSNEKIVGCLWIDARSVLMPPFYSYRTLMKWFHAFPTAIQQS